MTNRIRSTSVYSVAMALAAAAGAALAGNLDPTGQAGQYQHTRPAVLIKGTGGTFAPSTLYAPFLLQNDQSTTNTSTQAFLNSAGVENVGGRPIGAVTTFGVVGTSTVAPRVVAVLGTTDSGSGLSSGASNNVINDEGAQSRSSSIGAILPDGTLVVRENFAGTGQNNVGFWNGIQSLGVAAGTQAPFKVIVNTAVNIGNATETAINPQNTAPNLGIFGQVQLSTPSAVRVPGAPANAGFALDEDLYVGQVQFNMLPTLTATQFPATFNGVAVYRGRDNSPVSGTPGPNNNGSPGVDHEAGWTQDAVPLPTNPPGETRTDARQTSPVLALVRTPGGRDVIYCVHGIGFAAGTPYSGGSARALYFAVDTITNPDGSRRLNYVGSNPIFSYNTILIEADAAGGEGTQHGRPYDAVAPLNAGYADHFNSDLNMKFVDHQGTGGGNSFANSQFDMNRKGQVAALWVNEGVFPRRFEVRVYDPIWDMTNDRIEGYTLSKVVAFNGDLNNSSQPYIVESALTTIQITPGVLGQVTLAPISGVALSDDGRVAFAAIKQKWETTGDWDEDPFTDDTVYLQNTTNAVYLWEPTTNTIHEIALGGQTGDVLPDAFPAEGPATNESLMLGWFPLNEESDSFSRDGLSRDGRYIAVNFRSGGNETVNGVNVELERLPSTLPAGSEPFDTFNDDGGVLIRGSGATLNERAVRGTLIVALGNFMPAVPVCCVGNADKQPGLVNFADITAVLASFNQPANPNGTTVGDANCDGVINFADVTAVLANFLNTCL